MLVLSSLNRGWRERLEPLNWGSKMTKFKPWSPLCLAMRFSRLSWLIVSILHVLNTRVHLPLHARLLPSLWSEDCWSTPISYLELLRFQLLPCKWICKRFWIYRIWVKLFKRDVVWSSHLSNCPNGDFSAVFSSIYASCTYDLKWLGPSSLQHSNKGGFQQLIAQISYNCDLAVRLCDSPEKLRDK